MDKVNIFAVLATVSFSAFMITLFILLVQNFLDPNGADLTIKNVCYGSSVSTVVWCIAIMIVKRPKRYCNGVFNL